MALKWTALGALPSIGMKPDYFAGEYLAVAGAHDDRYRDAIANGPNLHTFLSKFESSHGQRLRPSLLIRSDAYPDRPNSEAISSFMDIVIACVVLDVRVRTVTWRRNVGPFYADSFEIYPWMIAPDGKGSLRRMPRSGLCMNSTSSVAPPRLPSPCRKSAGSQRTRAFSSNCMRSGSLILSTDRTAGRRVPFSDR